MTAPGLRVHRIPGLGGRILQSHSTPQSPLCSCPVASQELIPLPAASDLNNHGLFLSEHPKSSSHTVPALGEPQGTPKTWRSQIQNGQRGWEQLPLLLQGWEGLHSSGPSKADDLDSPRCFMVRDERRDPAQPGTSSCRGCCDHPSADSK